MLASPAVVGANPFEPPKTSPSEDVPLPPGDARSIRTEHRGTEEDVRRAASWLILIAILLSLGMVSRIDMLLRRSSVSAEEWILTAVLMGLALAYAAAGLRTWVFDRRFRAIGGLIAVPIMLLFPFGTWLGARILILFFSEKTAGVFTDEYAKIRAATPDIRLRIVRILGPMIGFLLAMFAGGWAVYWIIRSG